MASKPAPINIQFPPKAQILFQPSRYKALEGSRGSAKSWSAARALLLLGYQSKKRILCCREYMVSLADSVHKLLSDQVSNVNLDAFYSIQKNTIIGKNGTEIFYAGLKTNINSIKSMEKLDLVWVEEAATLSEESLQILLPTVRAPGSEIWFTWNPCNETDPVYQRFVVNKPDNCLHAHMTYRDNPWFNDVLEQERLLDLERMSPEEYAHVWEGETKKLADSIIFKGKFVSEAFETPERISRYLGADFGFANDPGVLISCFVKDECLHVDHEAYKVGVELDDLPEFYDSVPGARLWVIRGDSSRPETISHLRRKRFRIEAAPKWPGSVEDGITFLKGFKKIVIHPRCVNTLAEFKSYSWKVNRVTNDIEPVPVDKNNHAIDALRYALSPLIKKTGTSELVWSLLAS